MKRTVLMLVVAVLLAPPAAAQFTPADYQQRREALAAQESDGVFLVLGDPAPVHDYLEFYQNPTMLYLTGIREPDAALVLVKRGGTTTGMVFVHPRDPAIEVWSGTRIGPAGATAIAGLPGRSLRDLRAVLDSLAGLQLPFDVGGNVSGPMRGPGATLSAGDQFVAALRDKHPGLQVRMTLNDAVQRLRGRKTPAELALIRKAVEITVESHKAAMRAAEVGMHEYELEALIEYGFRRAGAERPAFASIVGSGPNSTVLHYNANDRRTEAGETVVMDIGASYQGYAADITRTIPLNGVFSPEQRAIYQIVRDAQAAAERNAKPGMSAQAMTDSAQAVIAAGLARLGLIESPAATYDVMTRNGVRQASQVGLFYMHGLGHGIGLEVHDPDQYYFTGTIAEGSAFTIEPGIYVREHVLEILADTPRNRALAEKLRAAVQRYRNIGVRIEDDYIVTDKGLEWISRAPREIAEIEAMMRGPTP